MGSTWFPQKQGIWVKLGKEVGPYRSNVDPCLVSQESQEFTICQFPCVTVLRVTEYLPYDHVHLESSTYCVVGQKDS